MRSFSALHVAAAALIAASAPAHATLITFDELPWVPIDSFSDYPVTTQYAGLGVTFQEGYLNQAYSPNPPPHPNQVLLGGNGFTVNFTGTLPTYVSFNMSSVVPGIESYVVASNNGQVDSGRTGGIYPDGSKDPPFGQDLPYQANRYIRLHSDTGIASLSFYDGYNSRTNAIIDNLYFGAVAAVPEPATLALWAAGLGVMAVARRRRRAQGPAV